MESGNKDVIVYSFDTIVTLAELEKKHIFTALAHTLDNKTHAADLLGISLKTLYNKLDEYSGKKPKKERKPRVLKATKTQGEV